MKPRPSSETLPYRSEGPVPSAVDEAYATTYYPGTPDSTQATIVEVGAGSDLQGFDVQLVHCRALHVCGRIVEPYGLPFGRDDA